MARKSVATPVQPAARPARAERRRSSGPPAPASPRRSRSVPRGEEAGDRSDRRAGADRRRTTEERLIAATRALIVEGGFGALGVNKVAARAGVPKQLIYRYFGDLRGLLVAAIESKDFWLRERLEAFIESLAGLDLESKIRALISGYAASLREDVETREIRRFEMVSDEALASMLAPHREQGGRIVARLLAENKNIDPAMFGIVLAGISYLVLRERMLSTYVGISIRGDEAWKRWEAAAFKLVELVCAASGKEPARRRR